LVYTEPGTYSYQIREVEGSEMGTTYDSAVIELTVTVTQTTDGLEASTAYSGFEGETPAFNNTTEGIDVEVYKRSRYGGEGLDNCTYALYMVGANGAGVLIQEATSDATGRILFTNVNLMKDQLYYFKEVEAPKGHTVDPYRTVYLKLDETGKKLVPAEETAADGWHSATENIETGYQGSSSGTGSSGSTGGSTGGSSGGSSTGGTDSGVVEEAVPVTVGEE
jgi:pilin isopeptide linkage protein